MYFFCVCENETTKTFVWQRHHYVKYSVLIEELCSEVTNYRYKYEATDLMYLLYYRQSGPMHLSNRKIIEYSWFVWTYLILSYFSHCLNFARTIKIVKMRMRRLLLSYNKLCIIFCHYSFTFIRYLYSH